MAAGCPQPQPPTTTSTFIADFFWFRRPSGRRAYSAAGCFLLLLLGFWLYWSRLGSDGFYHRAQPDDASSLQEVPFESEEAYDDALLSEPSWADSQTEPEQEADSSSSSSTSSSSLIPQISSSSSSPSLPSSTAESTSPPPQSSSSKCNVIKVSMLYGTSRLPALEAALQTHLTHAERWNCGFEWLSADITTGRNGKMYSKQYFLISIMIAELAKPAHQRRQWLMWVDADSMTINPALSPDIFLPPAHLDSVYALLTADHNGFNAGIFYLRVHPHALDLLTRVVALPLDFPDVDLGYHGEQTAMARVVAETEARDANASTPYAPGVAWVPRQWFNAYEFQHAFEGAPGHALVHFAGLAETKLAHMGRWLEELERNQSAWEVPYEDTFYRKDVPKFWAEFGGNVTSRRAGHFPSPSPSASSSAVP